MLAWTPGGNDQEGLDSLSLWTSLDAALEAVLWLRAGNWAHWGTRNRVFALCRGSFRSLFSESRIL